MPVGEEMDEKWMAAAERVCVAVLMLRCAGAVGLARRHETWEKPAGGTQKQLGIDQSQDCGMAQRRRLNLNLEAKGRLPETNGLDTSPRAGAGGARAPAWVQYLGASGYRTEQSLLPGDTPN
ncbi:unnamed protein product [Clonostachys byssicola]|uniref:Uncharacterized protein n=1 Tax=Clonostachys byssicola TaxID=160290 RepID=A0A9N9TXV6_9HYPO|nr:unnamed protein product [Clonostachys byssicola]